MKKTELGLTTFQGELAERLEAYLKRENPDMKHMGDLRRAVLLRALRRFLDAEMPEQTPVILLQKREDSNAF